MFDDDVGSQEHKPELDTILLMLSGGLDSTYLLYWYLTETENPIHVHHVSMRQTPAPRWKPEDEATQKIIDFCLENYRPFDYSESRFDFGFTRYVGWDSDFHLFVATRVAPNLDGARITVALGWNWDDYINPVPLSRNRAQRGVTENLWAALLASVHKDKNINAKIAHPLEKLKISKADILQNMPPGLLELYWSCRMPRTINGRFVVCDQCHPCKEIKEARQKLTADSRKT